MCYLPNMYFTFSYFLLFSFFVCLFFFLYFLLDFTSNPTPTRPPILIRVNVSEGDDATLNCVTKNIKGNNEYRWSREGEGPVETTSRTLEDEKSKLRIKQVAVRDSGIYNCENGVDKYIFTVTVSGKLL